MIIEDDRIRRLRYLESLLERTREAIKSAGSQVQEAVKRSQPERATDFSYIRNMWGNDQAELNNEVDALRASLDRDLPRWNNED